MMEETLFWEDLGDIAMRVKREEKLLKVGEMRWLKEERVRSHKNEGENEEGGERDDKCLNLVKNVKPVQCQYK